jgi:hypothetical protein
MDPAAQQQQQQPGEPEAFSQFPAPPGFYQLYEAGPDAGPPPPRPLTGQIHALGEAFDTVSQPCCRKHGGVSWLLAVRAQHSCDQLTAGVVCGGGGH